MWMLQARNDVILTEHPASSWPLVWRCNKCHGRRTVNVFESMEQKRCHDGKLTLRKASHALQRQVRGPQGRPAAELRRRRWNGPACIHMTCILSSCLHLPPVM